MQRGAISRARLDVGWRRGGTSRCASASSLDVVSALLALSADPNAGLEIATKLPDAAILRALLDAGANPNYADDRGSPGRRSSSRRRGTIGGSSYCSSWHAAPMQRSVTGREMKLADVVESRMQSTTARPPEMKADIARVKAQLSAAPARP